MSEFSEKDVQSAVSDLESKSASAARLFDIRRLIGSLFTIYGVIVMITGIVASDASLEKSQGININLWTGLGMLILGLLFLLWMKLRPLAPPTDLKEAMAEELRKGKGEPGVG